MANQTNLDARALIFALHKHDGGPPVSKLPGLWYRRLDDQWEIWVNGHLEPLALARKDGVQFTVQPGDCYVEYNGWPAGSLSLVHGFGIIAAGDGANIGTFCAALRKAGGAA